MKRTLAVTLVLILVISMVGCGIFNTYEKTEGIIIRKEIKNDDQYIFYLEYRIEGKSGTYETSVNIKNRIEYDAYNIGDKYIFPRPIPIE